MLLKLKRTQRHQAKAATSVPLTSRLLVWRVEDLRLANADWGTTTGREWDALRNDAVRMLLEIHDGALPELCPELAAEVDKWHSHRLLKRNEYDWSKDWAVILTRSIAATA